MFYATLETLYTGFTGFEICFIGFMRVGHCIGDSRVWGPSLRNFRV